MHFKEALELSKDIDEFLNEELNSDDIAEAVCRTVKDLMTKYHKKFLLKEIIKNGEAKVIVVKDDHETLTVFDRKQNLLWEIKPLSIRGIDKIGKIEAALLKVDL